MERRRRSRKRSVQKNGNVDRPSRTGESLQERRDPDCHRKRVPVPPATAIRTAVAAASVLPHGTRGKRRTSGHYAQPPPRIKLPTARGRRHTRTKEERRKETAASTLRHGIGHDGDPKGYPVLFHTHDGPSMFGAVGPTAGRQCPGTSHRG
eukprot:scaffold2557_cov363-Pavlova_lutheri.AAC.5